MRLGSSVPSKGEKKYSIHGLLSAKKYEKSRKFKSGPGSKVGKTCVREINLEIEYGDKSLSLL